MVRKIFEVWWSKHEQAGTHSLGQTKEGVLLDFIDTLVGSVIKSHELQDYLDGLYDDEFSDRDLDTLTSFFCDSYSLPSLHEECAGYVADGKTREEIEAILDADPLVRVAVRLEMVTKEWLDGIFTDLEQRRDELLKMRRTNRPRTSGGSA